VRRRARFQWALVGLLVLLAIYYVILRNYGVAAFALAVAVLVFMRIQYDEKKGSDRPVTPRTFAIAGSVSLVLAGIFAVSAVEISSSRVLGIIVAVLFLIIAIAMFAAMRKLSQAGRNPD
jgi:hypothetical protein